MMKKQTRIIVFSLLLLGMTSGFCYQIYKLIQGFITPDGFVFTPAIWAVLLLIGMFASLGGFVTLIGYKDPVTQVIDEPEWWTKWDRV